MGSRKKAGRAVRASGTAQDLVTPGKSSFDPQAENHCFKGSAEDGLFFLHPRKVLFFAVMATFWHAFPESLFPFFLKWRIAHAPDFFVFLRFFISFFKHCT